MANLIATEPTHHRIRLRAATNRMKIQDVTEFLLDSGLNLSINDGIMAEIMKVAEFEKIGTEEVLTFLCANWQATHGRR